MSRQHLDYDLIVIGSGAGGGVAAHIIAIAGKKVAIVEDEKVGGECPNFGCIPTKALLHSAEIYESAKNGEKYGIRTSATSFHYPTIKKWKDLAVLHTGTSEGEKAYLAEGIALLRGHAHFIDPNTLSVSGKRFTAKKFLIATGTKNFIPPIDGLTESGYITYRDAIELKSPPKSLFIVGGGAIGVEFAQLFSIFGTSVHIAEMTSRLLFKEDADVGELVRALFERDRGIKVHTETRVTKVENKGGKKIVHYEKSGDSFSVKVDEVLMAAGKVPNTDLGLENAGVEYDNHGIKVNSTMRTNVKHIFAAGDVTGLFMFTHTAAYQSRIAAHNILHTDKVHAKYHAIPRCVFTSPEVASVGMTEQEVKEKKIKYKVGASSISVIGRANTSDVQDGFVKVIATKKGGVIIGASIVSPHAGEMIHELALAVQHGLTVNHIESTVHAFPTWSEAIRTACAKIA